RIGGHYFESLGVALTGRTLTAEDTTNVLVNQIVADRYFAGTNPIGQRLQIRPAGVTQATPWLTIVGVTPAIPQRAFPDPDPVVYLPWRPVVPATASFAIRGPADPLAMASEVREIVRGLDPDLAIYRVLTLEQAAHQGQWNGRMSDILISVIAGIAVALY